MANKPIQLSIPTPCQQRWEAMKIAKDGRYCGNCQKTVVNFAAINDQQIAAYFSSQPINSVCGRLNVNQLNRNLVAVPDAPNHSLKQRWLGFITAGLVSWSTAQGQSTQPTDRRIIMSGIASPESKGTDNATRHEAAPVVNDSTWVIEGQVIDGNSRTPMAGAAIEVKGLTKVTTDAVGRFKLTLFDYPSDKLTLIVKSIGYITHEVTVNALHKRELVISLAQDTQMLGEVVMTGTITIRQKPTFFQRLRNRVRATH